MAKRKANVEVFPQLQAVVDGLIVKYPVALVNIDSKRILYLKSDAKSKRVARISAINVPHPSVTLYKFALVVYPQFNEVDEARQVLHILRELLRIEDFEECELGHYPLQDFPVIIEKYGTTWEDREDIENPLVEKT